MAKNIVGYINVSPNVNKEDSIVCKDCFGALTESKKGYEPITKIESELDIYLCEECGKELK